MNRVIAYTQSFKKTLIIGLVLGASLPLIVLSIAPFDSDQYDADYGVLRILGYALVIAIVVLLAHFVENRWYNKNNQQWKILNELLFVVPTSLLIVSACAAYNFYVINELSGYQWNSYLDFMLHFGLPFVPILTPIWLFLRAHFGQILLSTNKTQASKVFTLRGDNKSEFLELSWDNFVYMQAQQNYVVVYYLEDQELSQQMLRISLAKLLEQLPEAVQVHRSFGVNLQKVLGVKGNSRKRTIQLKHTDQQLPVSKKYYEAIKNRATN